LKTKDHVFDQSVRKYEAGAVRYREVAKLSMKKERRREWRAAYGLYESFADEQRQS
jgi:hypothetical protein